MNQRIKELIAQSTVNEHRTPFFYRFSNKLVNPNESYLDAELFAKLIIEECVKQCVGSLDEDKVRAGDKTRTDIQRIVSGTIVGCTINSTNRIKQHFGIEV